MVAKKKTKKKRTRPKRTAAKNGTPIRNPVRKELAKKKVSSKKKLGKKKPSLKEVALKPKALGKKRVGAKTPIAAKKLDSGGNQSLDTGTFAAQGLRSRSAGQAGDLQGLSNVEGANSESVGELLEEGNAFEADVVTGVEAAADADEKGVRTHEVSVDDVPGEYLDKE
jgi:hypothetical protein